MWTLRNCSHLRAIDINNKLQLRVTQLTALSLVPVNIQCPR